MHKEGEAESGRESAERRGGKAGCGDPRVARTCGRVLDAAGRLLIAEGAGAVTFDRVSRETGVSRTTLYRHWARPVDLLIQAYRQLTEPPRFTPGDDLAHDLAAMIRGTRDGLQRGVWTRALPSLIDAAERDPELAALHAEFTDLRRAGMLDRLRHAAATGEMAAGADVDWLCDLLIAPVFFRRYHRHTTTSDDWITAHVRRCLRAAAPASEDARR